MNKGILYAIIAFGLWGTLPLFWKELSHVAATETLGHRIIWSFITLIIVLSLRRQWTWLKQLRQKPRLAMMTLLAAVLLTLNWGIFIGAMSAGFIVEASLGYFINPLLSVALGVLLMGERMRPWQTIALFAASLGVVVLTVALGKIPWLSLSLAGTFGVYGLLKKKTSLDAVGGMAAETMFMFIPALVYLGWSAQREPSAFFMAPHTTFFLILTGIVTLAPLIAFAAAASRIDLSILGLLQYIAPTLQFLIGVFVYHEPFGGERLVGFGIIWAALVLFALENVSHARRMKKENAP